VDSVAIRTIDAAFARNRRDAKRPIIRLGGNAWPLLRRSAANRCRSDPYPPIRVRERHRDVSIKENHMSSIANLTSTPALAQLSTHLHGHKKGSHVASADDSDSSSNTAAPVPAGTQKNLFGSLLQSLEQVIGVQLSAAAPAAATSAAAPATAAAAASQHANSPQIAGSKVNVVA
jgi:hypothetical protein